MFDSPLNLGNTSCMEVKHMAEKQSNRSKAVAKDRAAKQAARNARSAVLANLAAVRQGVAA